MEEKRTFYVSRGHSIYVKGYGIWEQKENRAWPVMYLRKPKRMNTEEFEEIITNVLGFPLK